GTSMAAPFVTGVAALVRSAHPSFDIEQVRQALIRGADDIGDAGFDPASGYGRLNAARAVAAGEPIGLHLAAPQHIVGASRLAAVYGTVSGSHVGTWRIEYGRGVVPSAWRTIATGSGVAVETFLGAWDLSDVADGDATLRLVAEDDHGVVYEYRD